MINIYDPFTAGDIVLDLLPTSPLKKTCNQCAEKHKYLSIQERATCHTDLHSDSLDGEKVGMVENGQNDD